MKDLRVTKKVKQPHLALKAGCQQSTAWNTIGLHSAARLRRKKEAKKEKMKEPFDETLGFMNMGRYKPW